MRGVRSTLVLAVAALALGAYIYFVESKRPPAGTPDPLETVFEIDADDVDSLTVTARGGDRTVVEKNDDRWRIVEPFPANVDVAGVVSLTSSLANLEMQRVVAEPEDALDLEPFGLTAPGIEVGFGTTEGADGRLLIGDRSPGGDDLYATVAGSGRVFLISGFLDTTFDRTTFDLRDKSILDVTRNQVDSIEVSAPGLSVRLEKSEGEWALAAPIEARADLGVTDGLVGRLATGRMAAIEQETADADDLAAYGLDDPRLTVTLGLGSSTAALHLGGTTPAGTVYARDAAREMVFTVDESLAAELEQGADEYRRKNLFAFRPFNAAAVEIDHEGERWAFALEPAGGEDETDTWRRTAPDAGDVARDDMDDLLAKLSNLRAESFEASREGTGLDAPVAAVTVTFDDDDRERVTVGRTGDDVFAVNGDEPGAARLNTRSWEDAVAALAPLRETAGTPAP